MFSESTYIPWALNTGTCIQQGDLFYFILFTYAGKPVLTAANTGKIRERSGKNSSE